jgi:DNA-binding beta-propeller fold protein YncE
LIRHRADAVGMLGRVRRSASLLALTVLIAVAAGCHSTSRSSAPTHATTAKAQHSVRRSAVPVIRRLADRVTGALGAPLQDAAAAPIGRGRVVLLGGLDAADTSTDAVRVVGGGVDSARGRLPGALHDAAAVRLGRATYLFGGGNGVSQLSDILRVDPRTGTSTRVGALPVASSDSAAAAVTGTAYVVGGYTGSKWLNTILAWRPGTAAHVVARLPTPLRYAAVAADSDELVIAGGSTPAGTASRSVYAFDPTTRRLTRVGLLPKPTTHAAAATLGEVTYVIGGRGPTPNTPTARIVAVEPDLRRIRNAGRLTSPRSDLAAVGIGSHIVLAGGRGATGPIDSVDVLVPSTKHAVRNATSRALPTTANVYANDAVGRLAPAARRARPLVYVPNSMSNTVEEIDPRTYRVVREFPVGILPQHVTPSWDLKTLYVLNDIGNSVTPIDPLNGVPGKPIPVDDPYNMYFTPNGRYAIVVAERMQRLDFRFAHTFELHKSVTVPCRGIDHMDFSADGRYAVASCEFSGQLVKIDVARERVERVLQLHAPASPQDVKLSPDGRVFYVADMVRNGVWEIDGRRLRVIGFLPTGRGAHGLYASRDDRYLYVTNRGEGTISLISFRTRRVVTKWTIPGGGSPDMGNVSADGRVLWVSGRWNGVVYAIDTRNGKLLAKIPVGESPHGLCVWPQPGRYSLGHTGILR